MSSEITREMLFNYFGNKATTLEKRRIDEWAKEPQNLEFFYETLSQWENENLQYVSDVEAAIRRHQGRQTGVPTATVVSVVKPTNSRRLFFKLSLAASILLGFVLVGFLGQNKILYKTLATTYGQTASYLLDDGTKVFLNANSTLTVPRFGFGHFTRNVALKGEASFSVTHLKDDIKFIVKTIDGPDVEVLGTEFSVYTRLHLTKVVLSKGKIQLNYRENQLNKNLIMNPGELVTIDAKGKAELRKTADPELFSAWKDHRYVFDHTSLQDLAILFEEEFGLKVEITDLEISNWTVSGAFMASDAQELLEALAESSGLGYNMENQKVTIHSIKKNK